MKEEFKKLVAKELKILRIKNNLTQHDVAKLSGLDKTTISRYENNATSMQIDMIDKILSVYNENLSNFFKNINANMHN